MSFYHDGCIAGPGSLERDAVACWAVFVDGCWRSVADMRMAPEQIRIAGFVASQDLNGVTDLGRSTEIFLGRTRRG